MKVSLKQAWEVKGLTGMALREGVRVRLERRYFKENPDKARLADKVAMLMIMTVVLAGFAYIAFGHIPRVAGFDFSQTVDVIEVFAPLTLFVIFSALAFYSGVKLYKAWTKIDYIERYLYKCQDEEIEL